MVKVKYIGTGLYSNGIHFRPDKNDGLYELNEKTANYLLKTFKNDFILIEKSSNTPTIKKNRQTKRQQPTKQADKQADKGE